MYRHILVGLDGSSSAQHAFAHALALARIHRSTLTLLSVEERLPRYAASVGEVEDAERELRARFEQIQQAAVSQATAQGITADTCIAAGSAAPTINRTAETGGHDLIVIGAGRHGGLWQSLLGATADRVVETAPCSVLVVRHSPLNIWAGEAMQRAVATVRAETPIAEVVALLLARDVKAVPVVAATGAVLGIITGGDLLERAGLPLRLSLHRHIDASLWKEELAALADSGMIASDIMSPDVVTIGERTPLREAARIMAQQHIKRVPVVDARGRLCGLLSRLDVLRHIAAVAPTDMPEPLSTPTGGGQFVRDVLDPNVPAVSPDTTLDVVVGAVVGTPLRRVVVVDGQRRVVGIITDADLLERLSGPARTGLVQALRSRIPFLAGDAVGPQLLAGWRAQRAEEVMRRDPAVVAADATIVAAIQLMVARRIKRVPVVDAHGRLVGIVDRQTILRAATQLP